MESDQNRTNITMIIVLIAIILLIAVLAVSNKTLKSQANTQNQEVNNNEEIEKDTSVEQPQLYKSYEIGDQVTLLDSSTWHVIKKTTQKENSITLLKDNKLTEESKKEEANNFLTTTYQIQLKDSLSALSIDIKEVRLITLDDIKEITGIETLDKDTSIEKENNSWLYQENTLTNNTSSNNIPLLICKIEEEETTRGKLCEMTDKEIWPIRPVITISKEYIKE